MIATIDVQENKIVFWITFTTVYRYLYHYNYMRNNKFRLKTEYDENILTEPKKELKNKPF